MGGAWLVRVLVGCGSPDGEQEAAEILGHPLDGGRAGRAEQPFRANVCGAVVATLDFEVVRSKDRSVLASCLLY
jgi:hypothetical protein